MVSTLVAACLALGTLSVGGYPQVPAPFPKPGQPTAPPQKPPVTTAQPATPAQPAEPEPTEATLGVARYPGAQFVRSFDAGLGQRYYLFGTNAGFAEIVAYYKNVLKQKGELVFEQPAVHQFDLARFREESMAFPPSVTVKDYAGGGSQGYLSVKGGLPAERFRTIIQIVPAPPGTPK